MDSTDDVDCRGFPGRADSKTAEAYGVEENVSFLQSLLPPSELKELKQKGSRKRKTQCMCATYAEAQRRKGRSRLVHNKIIMEMSGTNNRAYLLDLITTILSPTKNKELI